MSAGDTSGYSANPQKNQTVFEWVDEKHQFLSDTHQQILSGSEDATVSRCLYLAHTIQRASSRNPVGLLAALQLNRTPQYQRIKELFVAVLCELLAKELGNPLSARLFLICAALTEDIGMQELQDQSLDRQSNPLNDAQKRLVNRHPHSGRLLMERARINEQHWLSTIEQHHEQPDGKGYPEGLKGGEISQSARILRVADTYVALVRPRGDRPALTPKEALREIFLHRGTRFDTVVTRTLVSILGMYPPGTWVQLNNGEMGVVSGIGSGHPFPKVSVILSAEGDHLSSALTRDTHDEAFTVIDVVRAPFHFSLTSVLNDIWPKMGDEPGNK